MNDPAHNVDPQELGKFDRLADRWWDPRGEFRPLHAMNAARLEFIDGHAPLAGRRVVDVGCGGGILSEGMARLGADVTGIDMAEGSVEAARRHAEQNGLTIDYRRLSAEVLAAEQPGAFDAVTCLELLEHVPDPGSLVTACHDLVRRGGKVFFSTVNRNIKAFLFAIVGAEYLCRMLPRGTHQYERFVRPSELDAWVRRAGLETAAIKGIEFSPVSWTFALGDNPDINYIACCTRPAD